MSNEIYNQKLENLIPILKTHNQIRPDYTLEGFIKWLNRLFFYGVIEGQQDGNYEDIITKDVGGKVLKIKKVIPIKKGQFYPCIYKHNTEMYWNSMRVWAEGGSKQCFQPEMYDLKYIIEQNGFNTSNKALEYIESWKYQNHPKNVLERIAPKNKVFQNSLFLITALDGNSQLR